MGRIDLPTPLSPIIPHATSRSSERPRHSEAVVTSVLAILTYGVVSSGDHPIVHTISNNCLMDSIHWKNLHGALDKEVGTVIV